jgi:hypothetical protein
MKQMEKKNSRIKEKEKEGYKIKTKRMCFFLIIFA